MFRFAVSVFCGLVMPETISKITRTKKILFRRFLKRKKKKRGCFAVSFRCFVSVFRGLIMLPLNSINQPFLGEGNK